MCKKICFLFSFIVLFASFSPLVYSMDVSAKGIVLIEANSGEIIFEKNAFAPMPMASTTKIMTALVVIENCDLKKEALIPKEAVGIEGSSIYLNEGEKLTIEELLYALLLESANDAAVALAYITAGGVDEFAILMNQKADELGLKSTHFDNPHGLDSENHYTSAYDLAKITAYAMKNPVFSQITSTYKKNISLNNGAGTRVLINHNKLLRSYDGTIGVKTGFTRKSGRCFVSCAERDGVRLICVSLNAPNDWNDHKSLLDYGFTKYESVLLANELDYLIELNVQNGEASSFYATNLDSLKITLPKGEKDISAKIIYNRPLYAPINEGELVGKIVFYNYENEIASLNLYATSTVNKINYKKSLFEGLFK
ncbi:MAG: D-alanyl-D-alanine carboxypeptidase [Clostridia bacterium]|nr:D-alanyl-D-alanine carboxypeptidase [Clostridia bacterium]